MHSFVIFCELWLCLCSLGTDSIIFFAHASIYTLMLKPSSFTVSAPELALSTTFAAFMSNQFPSTERLKSRKTIESLFRLGSSFMAYPLKVVWCEQTMPVLAPIQMTVAVPKRIFKSAVDRNLMKRRTREAWRLHKSELLKLADSSGKNYAVMFVYVGKEALPYADIEKGIKKAIRGLGNAWTQ